jgi:cytochrome c oxidase subunit 2
MVGYVYVLSPQDYNDWMNNDGNRFKPVANTMVAAGQQLFQDRGCANCHGVRDTLRAPTLNSISGSKITLEDGSTVVADEDFLRESIVNPYNKITKGYSNTMPAYAGQLTEEQILSLITYMKSLSNVAPGEKAPTERQMPATRPNQTGPQNATDIANQKVSAGAAQAKQLESKP